MKKRALSLLLILVLLLSLAPGALAAVVKLSTQNLSVDGETIKCEKYNIDDSNYFKLRDLAYVLNGTGSQFSVDFDRDNNAVLIRTGEPYTPNGTELVIGDDKSSTARLTSQKIYIDGKRASDISVYNIGGNNYFKLRDLGDYLNFDVDFNPSTWTAMVISRDPVLPELTAEQIYASCSPSVFYVEIYDEYGWCTKTGSGFFLTSDGIAVTNYHVISGADSAAITVSDTGAVYDVLGVYDYSVDEDWAILQIDGSGFRPLTIGAQDYDVGGATVYAIGSPLGLQNTISVGIISNPHRWDGGVDYIQMSAAISPGSSGGALLNKYGQVIGITSATYTDGQNLNLAIPMSYLDKADIDTYTPLGGSGSSGPSGILTLARTQVTVGIDRSEDVFLTAVESNCTGVSVRYVIGSTDVVKCEWLGWSGDDNTLRITGVGIGSTEVTVYFLISESETILDSKTIQVTVTTSGEEPIQNDDVTFSLDLDTLKLSLFAGGELWVQAAYPPDDPNTSVSWYADDPSILNCEWGDWDGDWIPLYIQPVSAGSTDLTIVYTHDDGTLLAKQTIPVNIFYAALEVSEDEVGMAAGDQYSITVTIRSDNPGLHTMRYDIYGDDIVSCRWGDWNEDKISCPLTITGLKPGEADVELTLLDKDTQQFLYSVSIPVFVE